MRWVREEILGYESVLAAIALDGVKSIFLN